LDKAKLNMAVETEKKYRLTRAQYEEVLANLKELKAEFRGEDFEVNELYGGGILEEQQAILRVRKIQGKTVLTYKRNLRNNLGIKQHTEYETQVSDAQATENIIKSLGFDLEMVYEKRRKTWNLNQVEVVLDELPFGLFMEVEGKVTEIAMIEMLLEAENYEVELNTYPKLTFDLGLEKNGVIEARFT
jgi:adenylate cyclase, class 2